MTTKSISDLPAGSAHFACADAAFAYICGGRSTVTLRSNVTGDWFTYRVRQSDQKPIWFVDLLVGSNNEQDFRYIGTLIPQRGADFHVLTAGAKGSPDAPGFKAFDWAIRRLSRGVLPDALTVFHEGRCGRCNRKLTTPESVETGFGPECVKHVQARAA